MTKDSIYRFDDFDNGKTLYNKKKGHLPCMGWNSWNAFGSGNTEELTKCMAEKVVELGLKDLGYEYIVLDDGCYMPERVDGLLSNETLKFPNGFKALSQYIHSKGLKFGMYNDIVTNLCAGAAVGTCGHEKEDAKTYLDWGVDFLKVDNCYYLWDNATFSNPENARYVFAPNIKSISINGNKYYSDKDGVITGNRAFIKDGYATFIGTFDGTGPVDTPVGLQSSELCFRVNVPKDGKYDMTVNYATGKEEGVGEFIQIAVGTDGVNDLSYDDFLDPTENQETFIDSKPISLMLKEGENIIRIMNHRRQENTLASYGELVKAFSECDPDNDLILSICEWGKTSPQNWGYKIGDSWRILNDITFQVGADGDPGKGSWESDYTTSVTAQYNKAVIMDEFSGPDKGYNDPDMMMIGMDGLDETMNRTHMTMWCLLNAPLMLGLDLRRVKRNDSVWNIISNKELIKLNQDELGIQAKRIFSSLALSNPDTEYIRDNARVDILAKPLADGSIALSIINLNSKCESKAFTISFELIEKYIKDKMVNSDAFFKASSYELRNLWSLEVFEIIGNELTIDAISPCDNLTYRIYPR